MADSVSVQVALRIRPFLDSEIESGCQMCLDLVPNKRQVLVKKTNQIFTFNHVFSPEDDNEHFYDVAIKDLVHHAFNGYNVAVLAYGQTASGKTFTMGTSYSNENDAGVIPRAVNDIFKNVAHKTDRQFRISVSFMELYKDQLLDLLSASKSTVEIRENAQGNIIIPGLAEVEVFTAFETTQCLFGGSVGRSTGATAMNAQSCRSHAIFTITIQQQSKSDGSNSMSSKFHFVDLAGSERPGKTKATSERFTEGVNINQGLLALGTVMSTLRGNSPNGYISYRTNKLTRLLKDSLGGNSFTTLIACVSPADTNLEETLNTLRYADSARKITNKPVVNKDPQAALIAKSKQGGSQEAQLELVNLDRNSQCPEEHKRLEEENAILTGNIMKLTDALHNVLVKNTNLVKRALLAEAARERMKLKLCELQDECGKSVGNLNQTMDPSTCPPEFWEQLNHWHDLQEKKLKELDRVLASKEKSVAQLAEISDQILNLEKEIDSTVKDLELQVPFLQKEKELVRSLQDIQNSTNASQERTMKEVNAPPAKKRLITYDLEDSMKEEDEDDNTEEDPDWQGTPVLKQIRSKKTKCKCKKGCSKNRCGCYKRNRHCSSACICRAACRDRGHNENVPDNFKKPRGLSFSSEDD